MGKLLSGNRDARPPTPEEARLAGESSRQLGRVLARKRRKPLRVRIRGRREARRVNCSPSVGVRAFQ